MNEIYDGVYKAAIGAGFQDHVAKDLASKAVRSERLKILGDIQKGLETVKVMKSGKPVGSISERRDGKYKKYGPGDWRPVSENGNKGETKNNFSSGKIKTIHGEIKIPDKAISAKEEDYFSKEKIERFNQRFDEGKAIREKNKGKTEYQIWNEMDQNDLDIYSNLGQVSEAFFLSGLRGEEAPKFTTGWRFGKAPDSGKSMNYAENRPEKGVSIMETRDTDKIQGMYELMTKETQKPYFYAGYELSSKGSDDEPLMIGLTEIN